MNDFRTLVSISPSSFSLGLNQPVITLGSCFSDAIGNRLAHHKVPTMVNPFGTVYNPYSIHKLLYYSLYQCALRNGDFLKRDGAYLNYDFHSQFASLRQDELSDNLMAAVTASHPFLKQASLLVITYGTAWVYSRNDTQEIVANCHKAPAAGFSKRLMSPQEIIDSFSSLHKALKIFNADLKIILTISPVKHLKDTLQLNTVSKSVLRLACHELTTRLEDVEYFPAYEIMLDDLRDYRFYKADMIHPSAVAEDYIWEKFVACYCSGELSKFFDSWNEIRQALSHKPFHPAGDGHQRFLKATEKKLRALQGIVFIEPELNLIQKQIISDLDTIA